MSLFWGATSLETLEACVCHVPLEIFMMRKTSMGAGVAHVALAVIAVALGVEVADHGGERIPHGGPVRKQTRPAGGCNATRLESDMPGASLSVVDRHFPRPNSRYCISQGTNVITTESSHCMPRTHHAEVIMQTDCLTSPRHWLETQCLYRMVNRTRRPPATDLMAQGNHFLGFLLRGPSLHRPLKEAAHRQGSRGGGPGRPGQPRGAAQGLGRSCWGR